MEVEEFKLRVPLMYWILIILCIVMLFAVDVFQTQYFSLQLTQPMFTNISFGDKSFTIKTPGCKIPYMDPFDQHIKEFLSAAEEPKCNNGKPPLFESNLTAIYLMNSSLSSYQINDTAQLDCCYAPFWRVQPQKGEDDNNIRLDSNCSSLNESADINVEFIQVTCTYDNITIYKDTFAFVPLKSNDTVEDDRTRFNVLVVGLDAVSRLNLHRQMPKTVNYLKQQEAVELLGYNKVGDNTFPNLIPILTGFSEHELRHHCWPRSTSRFDKCDFIWKLYKKEGYMTTYGEDASWMGLFNYQRKGFTTQSTDYAYGYFNRYSEHLIGNAHSMNVFDCVGGRLVYKDLLDYIKKFVLTMDSSKLPYFGFFWGASLSHDYLNKPQIGDKDYYLFFKELLEGNLMNNTVLIFISDHGIRWGGIRQTFQGRMEERLPFVYVLLPKLFKNSYPIAYRNLKINAKRLTTPYDLHETLVDLTNPSNQLAERNLLNSNQSKRGISFFRLISHERSCEDAGIESHWCTCQQSGEIDSNDTIVLQAADFTVLYINGMLEGYAQCANLTLDKITNARLMTHNAEIDGSNKISDYMLTVRTVPGEAIFEVTVRFTEKAKKFEVVGTISRLNLYGKQSACLTDFHLKLYCYCTSLL